MKRLVGVYIDITGNKEIYKRPEMVHLLKDCKNGSVNLIFSQTRAYLAANTCDFCFLLKYLFDLPMRMDIVTDDDDQRIDTILDVENQRQNLKELAEKYTSIRRKPAVSIKYGVMKFNMACIRLFEGIKYVLPILHPNKKRLALIMCPEEDSASVEWARQKDENWVNKDITSLEFVENIFKIMSWNRGCRYKILGRVANSDQGLCMLFDLEEAIMFTPKPQEYTDPLTGEMKKKQIKFFPDVYKDRIGKSYNDYIAGHQMNLFEDFIGYQGSVVLDEPEQKTDTISVPIPQGEGSGNTPLPDLPEQPENVQRPGSAGAERGMLT